MRPTPEKINTDAAYLFQFICSCVFTRINLYTAFSQGVSTLDSHVFSPSMTFLMYAPSGIASAARMAR